MCRGSHEWKAIETKIRRSLPSVNIDRIDRNQNTWIWEGYKFSKRRVCKKNNGIVNEAELFYGNSHQDPITICISEEGLDMSTYTAGSLGIGAYFTREALHSHPHAFESAGSKSLILVYMILGQCKMVGTEKNPDMKFVDRRSM